MNCLRADNDAGPGAEAGAYIGLASLFSKLGGKAAGEVNALRAPHLWEKVRSASARMSGAITHNVDILSPSDGAMLAHHSAFSTLAQADDGLQ